MARKPRFKPYGDDIYYHLYSRTVGQEFFLKEDIQKKHFLEYFIRYSSIFFVTPIAFCIMDNHFHIIIKSVPSMDYTEEEIRNRIAMFRDKEFNKIGFIGIKDTIGDIKEDLDLSPEEYQKNLNRLGDISEYIKRIKESYAMWYNKVYDRTGTLWGDRYKDVILERGRSLLMCSSYVELNPVRANIVDRPDVYKWNSLYARQHKTDISRLLSFVGIYDEVAIGRRQALTWYRKYVFISGGSHRRVGQGIIKREVIEMEEKSGYSLESANALIKRIPHFTGGSAIGGKRHISRIYKGIESCGLNEKRDRSAYAIYGLGGLYSLRRLKSIQPG